MKDRGGRKQRFPSWLLLKSQALRALIVGCLVLVGLTALFVALAAFFDSYSDSNRLSDLASILGSAVTIVAIVLGGVFALTKLQAFRDFEPHLTITHEVSHRLISDSYVQIDVTASLHNSSKVQIELNKGFFRLQHIAPLPDHEVEELYAQVFIDKKHEDMRWPTLEEVQRSWDKGELMVEPGESHPETYEFIVSRDVEAVLIYTYFYNLKYVIGKRSAEGWHATTVHDIFDVDR